MATSTQTVHLHKLQLQTLHYLQYKTSETDKDMTITKAHNGVQSKTMAF